MALKPLGRCAEIPIHFLNFCPVNRQLVCNITQDASDLRIRLKVKCLNSYISNGIDILSPRRPKDIMITSDFRDEHPALCRITTIKRRNNLQCEISILDESTCTKKLKSWLNVTEAHLMTISLCIH